MYVCFLGNTGSHLLHVPFSTVGLFSSVFFFCFVRSGIHEQVGAKSRSLAMPTPWKKSSGEGRVCCTRLPGIVLSRCVGSSNSRSSGVSTFVSPTERLNTGRYKYSTVLSAHLPRISSKMFTNSILPGSMHSDTQNEYPSRRWRDFHLRFMLKLSFIMIHAYRTRNHAR